MYGSSQTNMALVWGTDQARLLHGDGIWSLGASGGQRYSVLGLPARMQNPTVWSSAAAAPVGFVGNSLVSVTETGAVRYDPARGSVSLWNLTSAYSTLVEHPMPAAALAGRTLLLATRDMLRVQDAMSGRELWQGPWPDETKDIVEAAREPFKAWQSLRWSCRGIFLYDGQGKTLTVDWKALTAGGDWMVPAGTRALVCLRGASAGLQSVHEKRLSD
ncbi:MAG: hypothetical protein U0984_05400, partial [Prosthecobacter sp.]|nr:hypothetical protein [Prosthecobacter sp.]